jgi:pyruvate/2-oxoglutarate/acetoin dehydrogenase E1 component
VVFLEHKGLYRRVQAKTLEPDADYILPLAAAPSAAKVTT